MDTRKSIEFLTKNAKETMGLGEESAQKVLETRSGERAAILGLIGNLGGGKTTFLHGFAKGLGIKEKVNSPTFIIMRRYKMQDARYKNFYHLDCYRLNKPREILDLGWKEIIENPKNIVAVEWAGKMKKIMPQETIWLNFEFVNDKTRKIVLK